MQDSNEVNNHFYGQFSQPVCRRLPRAKRCDWPPRFPGCAFGVLAGGEVVLEDALGRFTYDEDGPE